MFKAKHNFPFLLLSDDKSKVVKQYGVKSWLPGKSARAVTVIDKEGIVRSHKVQTTIMFKPSDEEVLKAIAEAGE